MLARLVLSLAIVMHAWPGLVCVASCRLRGSQRATESCMMVCVGRPVVIGGACASGQAAEASCCAKRCQEERPVPAPQRPGKPAGCQVCAWLFCSFVSAPKFLPAAESEQPPQPDSTPLLPWFYTPAHIALAPNRAFAQAPPRPPWTPVRSMLSVWTI